MSAHAPDAFAAEGLHPTRWSNGPGATYPAHRHAYRKVLVCTEGSIVFHTPGGDVALGPGDRLDLPAGTEHRATVGPGGVVCWEAAAD
ncbi:MAG: cupin domain-containing protein [Actinobacteria bacterium]|nr:cupin domain-containing protein [Actinomycetota bacterium]